MYTLKEGARFALRSYGSTAWSELKSSPANVGIPVTLGNFLDYDDLEMDYMPAIELTRID